MTTTKMTSIPWDNLPSPSGHNDYISRLVGEAENPNERKVYWGRSFIGRPALLIEYDSHTWRAVSIPEFKNIDVSDHPTHSSLVLELLDPDMLELFLALCLDLISSLQDVDPKMVRQVSILRLEWWSALLSPSRNRLSAEAQKGLIAELLFLRRDAFATLGFAGALQGWVGPEHAQRDFTYGQTFIEVKSTRSSANHRIEISSENQLNHNGSEKLYLYVIELNAAPNDAEDAFTITNVVDETRNRLPSPLLRALFDKKLGDTGYFGGDDYSEFRWTEGEAYYYDVNGTFPRIDSTSCPAGVERVKYQIDLDYCGDYLVDRDVVIQAMR